MGVIWIVGGTSEGRRLARRCAECGLPTVVSVATGYGEEILSGKQYGEILQGRMDQNQMREHIRSKKVELVIDATHPYAVEVTENIRGACEAESVEYLRLLREPADMEAWPDGTILVDSVSAAIAYLSDRPGNIMLTTGSKDLPAFCEGLERQRLYPRVLPSVDSLRICEENGIPQANCIAMQGPFSEAVNLALLLQFQCQFLVTKESGAVGGLEEKRAACQKAGATAVVIRRPVVENGLDFDAVCGYLSERYSKFSKKPEQPEHPVSAQHGGENQPGIDIVGIGMGAEGTMTGAASTIINRADVLIGGKRMLERYESTGKILFDSYQAEEIRQFIDALPGGGHSRGMRIAVLMSGDVGFYSGTKKLLEALGGYEVRLHPGISSVAYMASKLGIAWQDMALCSVHGRSQNVLANIRHHESVFALVGNGEEINTISSQLIKSGMGQVEIYVGENLSYENERIWHGTPEDGLNETFGKLCVAVFRNHEYRKPARSAGIPDDAFIRGKVPMTKEEVRTISISKLQLTRDAVMYDIGAGTGSVSIEAALAAEDGRVYAIEKKDEAADLMEANAERFGVTNLTVVRGTAPDALSSLPMPTHAFIGGSSGNLKDIIAALLAKNPDIRIVMNAISLETIAELTELSKSHEMELVSVTVARANVVGNYHLMMGQNPVMIGTMKGR